MIGRLVPALGQARQSDWTAALQTQTSVLCLHDRVGARSIAAVTDCSPSAYVCRSIDKCLILLNVTTLSTASVMMP
jgi:hypothetical protein